MKRTLLTSLTLICFLTAFGQYRGLQVRGANNKVLAITNPNPDGTTPIQQQPAVPTVAGLRNLEEEIGKTNFDIQAIASLGRRISEPSEGTIGAAWQMSLVQPGWPDRGTGYNHFSGGSWGPNPTAQVEGSRSGYPSYTVMENGTEVVISHKALAAGWQLIAYTKPLGSSTWTEHILPSDVPGGNVWAKIAAGGADGNSLHVVGITLNPSFGGSVYRGMTNHPLYWRSTDGGQTWDKQDVVLPGVDSSAYLSVGAESYNIEARGETVAISITSLFGDILVIKSEDNGETWEKNVVYDFPLDKWNGEPYTPADLPVDPNAPDSLTTFSCDGSGSMVIDDDGDVHLFFAELYANGNPVDSGIYLSLGTNGISHWDEGTGTFSTITGAEDWDGDLALTLGDMIGNYRYSNSSLASFPSASIDDDGHIYLTFAAFHELFVSTNDRTYRHIFIIKSEDGGETWTAPFDIINPDVTEVPEFVEAAFPAIPARTGDAIQLIYQQDYEPGLTPDGTTVPDQYIMYVTLDKTTFGVFSGTTELESSAAAVSLSPNPTHGFVQVGFELNEPAAVKIGLYNQLGKLVLDKKLDILPVGTHRYPLTTEGVAAGIYFVKLEMDGQAVTKKLLVK